MAGWDPLDTHKEHTDKHPENALKTPRKQTETHTHTHQSYPVLDFQQVFPHSLCGYPLGTLPNPGGALAKGMQNVTALGPQNHFQANLLSALGVMHFNDEEMKETWDDMLGLGAQMMKCLDHP